MTFVRRFAARAAAAAGFLLIAAPNAGAQGADPAATHPGALSLRADQQVGMVIASPVQRRAAFTAADAIVALLRSDAAVASPVGYSVVLRRVAGMTKLTPDERPMTGRPVFGVLGSLSYFAMDDDGRGGRRVGDGGGSVPFSVVVNAPGRYTDAEELAAEPDHGPSILSDIRRTGVFRGHPIYNGECVAVYGGSAPPFVALTIERYYRLVMLDYRADSVRHAAQRNADASTADAEAAGADAPAAKAKREADMKQTYETLKKIDPKSAEEYLAAAKASEAEIQARLHHTGPGAHDDSAMTAIINQGVVGEGQRIAEFKAKLDALSPADRQAPVAVTMHQFRWNYQADGLADIADTAQAPLVQLNPAFFDKSRSEMAAQIVTVCIPGLQGLANMAYDRLAGPERDDERRMLEQRTRDAVRIRDHLDWGALEALVKP